MAWRWPGDKPLSEPMLLYFTDAYVSLGLSELRHMQTWYLFLLQEIDDVIMYFWVSIEFCTDLSYQFLEF